MNLQMRPMILRDVLSLSKMYLSLPEDNRRFFCPFPFQVWKLIPVLIYIALSNKIGIYLRKISPKLAFLSLVTIDAKQQKIVGFAYLRMKSLSLNGAYIANLGIIVQDNYQNKGIGSILIGKLIATAKDNHIKKITLQVVAENDPAIRVYKKYGFKIVNVIRMKSLYNNKLYPGYDMALTLYHAKSGDKLYSKTERWLNLYECGMWI